MDFVLLSERLEGDMELLRDLAALYIKEYPVQLERLQSAVLSSDIPRIQRAAHKIKGTATSFAAAPAVELARELVGANDFGDGTEISKMAGRLSDELRRLHFALEQFCSGS